MASGRVSGGPDFILIGAQKSGTSALRRNLSAHDSIRMVNKEIHFFGGRNNWDRGIDWYLEHFTWPDKVQGEKTPDYLDNPKAAGRIASIFPKVKLLVLLRDPVTRAYSHWNQVMQKIEDTGPRGWESVSFEEAISRASNGVKPYIRLLDKGLYINHIERYLQYFPREQLFIGIQERFLKNGEEELARVLRFLGVDELPIQSRKWHERKYDSPMSPAIKRQLLEYYVPSNQRLFKFLGEEISEWGAP